MDMQERDFRWFHGLQPLSPIFLMYTMHGWFERWAIELQAVGIDLSVVLRF